MTTEGSQRDASALGLVGLLAGLLVGGCSSPASEDIAEGTAAEAESWSVTAWGAHYEIFPEVGPLVAGGTAEAHTHVTQLEDFSPMVEGAVEIVLAGPSREQVFRSEQPVRPGIFNVSMQPAAEGEYELLFRISGPSGREEIPGGRVRVGPPTEPGGVVVAPAPRGASGGGEPTPFFKEEQWRSDFGTAWVRRGNLSRSVSGFARVRSPAGGDAAVTSPVDGVVQPAGKGSSWPFPGQGIQRGAALFRVVPRVAADRSLSSLEADLASLEAELGSAQARLQRLEELLELEATSLREVEEARVRFESLTARRGAATRDLASARSSRQGGAAGGQTLRAPLSGEIATVTASPGATVAAGEVLSRIVRTDRRWLDVALSPEGARRLATDGVTGVVLSDGEGPPVHLEEGLRLVSVAPELSQSTGTVSVLLEAPAGAGLTLGTTLEAQVLLRGSREGIVIPASAVVDDGGVAIVYLQLSGESFVRQQVRVLERQGERVLVEGLAPGQRLATLGGEAIRRSSLMSRGEAHGHVH